METLAWMIRHGQSEANAGTPSSHHGSPPLTDLGRRQAAAAADLVTRPPDRVVTSGFIRAIQTGEPVLHRFPGTPAEVWDVEEFTYLAPEAYRRTTTADRRPAVREYWERCDPDHRDGDGAETFREFIARVSRAEERLRALPGFTVMVSHGQFIRGLVWWRLNNIRDIGAIDSLLMSRYRDFRTALVLPNACIVKMGWPEGDGPWFSGVVSSHASAVDDES